jgi:ribosomal protein S12 methylthiotransferase accessory factor
MNFRLFFTSKELDEDQINNIYNLLRREKICDIVYKLPRWVDLPIVYQYCCAKSLVFNSRKRQISGVGTSLISYSKAFKRSIAEFVERYSLRIFNHFKLKKFKYKDAINAIKLEDVLIFSDKQTKTGKLKGKIATESDSFYFVEGYNLTKNKKVLIPAQLVFVPFKRFNEKIIRESISTGGAAGFTLSECLIKGMLEIIERDAFMVYYLNNTLGYLIDLDDNAKLKDIYKNLNKYKLKAFTFFLQTDIRIYNIVTIIIDKTGIGPSISCGASSDFILENAIIKSIEEALQVLSWIRNYIVFERPKIFQKNLDIEDFDIKERGYFWSRLEKLGITEKLINNSKKIKYSTLKKYLNSNKLKTNKHKIEYLVNQIQRAFPNKHDIYYCKITHPKFIKYGFKVVKVIIPQFYPLYLDEDCKYLGSDRIYNLLFKLGFKNKPLSLKELNKVPHFFL